MGSKLKAVAAVLCVLAIGGMTYARAGSPARPSVVPGQRFHLFHLSESGDDDGSVATLRVRGERSTRRYLDLGDAGFSLGDQFAFTNDLLRDGEKVGEDGGLCVVVRLTTAGASTFKCVGSNYLPGGQITVQGLVTYGPDEEFKADPYLFAITGGTGRYRTAQGDVKIRELGGGRLRIAFRLSG